MQLNGAVRQKLFGAGRSYPDGGRGKVSWDGSDLLWAGDCAVATLSPGCLGLPWDLLAACTGSGEMWCRILWEKKKKWEGMRMTGSPPR